MKLFIIGNGFDIKHGMNTKYHDFYKFVKCKHRESLELLEKEFGLDTDVEWNHLEQTISKKLHHR